MLESPLSPEEVREAGKVIFEVGNISQAEWENLSDADKAAVNEEAERLQEEADETSDPLTPKEVPPTPKL